MKVKTPSKAGRPASGTAILGTRAGSRHGVHSCYYLNQLGKIFKFPVLFPRTPPKPSPRKYSHFLRLWFDIPTPAWLILSLSTPDI